MVNDIDDHPILEHEPSMKGLDLKGKAFITPYGFLRLVANITILIVIELHQAFRHPAVITEIGLFR